jgi:hypothetical protein
VSFSIVAVTALICIIVSCVSTVPCRPERLIQQGRIKTGKLVPSGAINLTVPLIVPTRLSVTTTALLITLANITTEIREANLATSTVAFSIGVLASFKFGVGL